MKHLIILLCATAALYGCDEQPKGTTPAAATPDEPKSNWSYETRTDKMSGEQITIAKTKSTNTVQFEFPYDGGSVFYLYLRKTGNQLDVIFEVSKGQFIPGFGDETVRVKFDNEQPVNYTYSMSESANMDYVFLNHEARFVKRLKTANKLLIEAAFATDGRKIAEFDVSGLEWP